MKRKTKRIKIKEYKDWEKFFALSEEDKMNGRIASDVLIKHFNEFTPEQKAEYQWIIEDRIMRDCGSTDKYFELMKQTYKDAIKGLNAKILD